MKPIVILSVVTSCLIAGFLGASVFAAFAGRRAESHEAAHAGHEAHPRSVAAPEAGTDGSAAATFDPSRFAEVDEKLARLEIEVASLREELARREAPEPAELAASPLDPSQAAAAGAVNRDAIVQVLEEQREKERLQREEERKKREREAIDRLAERTAKDLGLSPADQTRLSEFMVVASTKRDELFAAARDGGPEGFRTTFDEFRTWRDAEVKRTFGEQLGQQLIDHQRQMRDGWSGGFGGFDRDRGSDRRDDSRNDRSGGRER